MRMVSKHYKYDEDGFQAIYKYDEDGLNENVNIVSARLLFRVWKLSINRRFLKQEGLINQSINQS